MSSILDIPPANPRLSNYAVGAVPADLAFIDRIAPVQTVPVRVGRYMKYSAPLTVRDDRIGPTTEPWPQVYYEATEDTFVCEAHGLEHPVPRLQDTGARDQQLRNGVFVTSRQVQFNKVSAFLGLIGDATSYGSFTASPSAKFDGSGTDIRAYFRANQLVASLGVRRNVAVMGADVFDAILANDVFQGSFKGFKLLPGDEAGLRSFVAGYLGLEDVIVVELAANTAADGLTPTFASVWPAETVAFFYRGPLATLAGQVTADEAGRPLIEEATPSFVRQIVWTGVPNAPTGIGAWTIENERAGFGVTLVRSAQIYAQPKIQMPGAGFLMTNVLA